MTNAELDEIGKEILDTWGLKDKQKLVAITSKHGFGTDDNIGGIPVHLKMQLFDGLWDGSKEFIWPLSEFRTKAFSMLYRLFNEDRDCYINVMLLTVALCFEDGEEEIYKWSCSKPKPWETCNVKWYFGPTKSIPTFHADNSIAGGLWYFEHSRDYYGQETERVNMVTGMRIDPYIKWGSEIAGNEIVVIDFTDYTLTFSFRGQTYTARYDRILTIDEHIEIELN